MDYDKEEIIQELTDMIADGSTDEMLMEDGYRTDQIEEADFNYLAIYF